VHLLKPIFEIEREQALCFAARRGFGLIVAHPHRTLADCEESFISLAIASRQAGPFSIMAGMQTSLMLICPSTSIRSRIPS
jgi:hypothetical protein